MRFFTLIFKNLFRRKTRSALTILGVAIAVTTLVTLRGVSQGFHRSFLENLRGRGIHLIVSERGKLPQGSTLPEEYQDRIRAIPGVKEVNAGLNVVIGVEKAPAVSVIGWPLGGPQFDDLEIVSGRSFSPGDEDVVMLGTILAESLNKQVGDTVEMYGEPFEVIGIYSSFTIFENGAAIMPLKQLQEYELREGLVTGFGVILSEPDNEALLERVREQINGLTDEDGESLRMEAHTTDEFVDDFMPIQLANAMALLTSVIAILIGAVGMLNTMVMSVLERVKEIGILRALGWRQSRVMRMILGESFVLSLVGAVVGILGALLATYWLTKIPGVNGYIDGKIPPIVMGEGVAMAALVGLFGGLYPAFRAARLMPTEALRHE